MKAALACLLSFAASSVAAQTTTNTNCQQIGNQVYCNSNTTGGDRGIDWSLANRGQTAQPTYDAFAAIQQNNERLRLQRQQQQELAARRALADRVGALIDAHDCQGAARAAFDAGDMQMAQLVPTLCTPK